MPEDQKSYLLNTSDALTKEKLRLEKQASAMHEIELPYLKNVGQGTFNSILDLGCGNAFYTSQLVNVFSPLHVHGYERNQELIKQAGSEFPSIEITLGDLTDDTSLKNVVKISNPDLVNLRFVLQHLRLIERASILSNLAQSMKLGAKILITEPDDSEIKVLPHSENINYLIDRTMQIQSERGGDRTVANKLKQELKTAGFLEVKRSGYALTNVNLPISILIDVILPIWKSYRNKDDRPALDLRINEARAWLEKHHANGSLHFEFPIYVFEATAPGSDAKI